MNCSVSVSIDAHIIFGGFLIGVLTLRYETSIHTSNLSLSN
jgi:hypothetical protein